MHVRSLRTRSKLILWKKELEKIPGDKVYREMAHHECMHEADFESFQTAKEYTA